MESLPLTLDAFAQGRQSRAGLAVNRFIYLLTWIA
jgi:hypothetical protein